MRLKIKSSISIKSCNRIKNYFKKTAINMNGVYLDM